MRLFRKLYEKHAKMLTEFCFRNIKGNFCCWSDYCLSESFKDVCKQLEKKRKSKSTSGKGLLVKEKMEKKGKERKSKQKRN